MSEEKEVSVNSDVSNEQVELPAKKAELPKRLSDADMRALERAQHKREIAMAVAKNATTEAEAAELAYKYLVIQIFLNYGMSTDDSFSLDGVINRKDKV